MDITLADVKLYCRIDGDAEDTLLQSLVSAAKDYLAGAGIPEPSGEDPRYGLAVKAVVLDHYDRRGLTQRPDPYDVPSIRNLINQMKLQNAAQRAAVAAPSAPSGGTSLGEGGA